MPIYEYKCEECKRDFEILVYGDKTVECPQCGSTKIKKKFSVFGMSGVEKSTVSTVACSSCGSKGSGCSSCG